MPLQLAIVGKPNVGKSTLLNALLEEERVLVGPEAGLTRDAVRVQFEFQGRTVYLVRLEFLFFLYSDSNYYSLDVRQRSGTSVQYYSLCLMFIPDIC